LVASSFVAVVAGAAFAVSRFVLSVAAVVVSVMRHVQYQEGKR
jgi:hypothetical protein